MENRIIFLFSFAFSFLSFAEQVEFPKGCPADNLRKICSTLGKIGNDKILLFADGTQLPACYTQTADESSRKEHYEAENELRKVLLRAAALSFFKRTEHLSDAQLKEVNDAVSNSMTTVASLSDLKEIDEYASSSLAIAAIDKHIAFKEKVRPPKPYFGKDILKDAIFAAAEIRKLAETLAPPGNPIRENIITGLETTRLVNLRSSKMIHCRPQIGAFHETKTVKDRSTFAMTPALSHYPPSTRIQAIGHEIAHKFDPCNLPVQKNSPLTPFVECLQNKVGDFKRSAFLGSCDPHTQEAFCDAFGIHVQEAWIKNQLKQPVQMPEIKPNMVLMPPGYENIFTHLDFACSSTDSNDQLSTHPNSSRRLADIILKSPVIAGTLGCPSDPGIYRCDIKQGAVGTPPGTLQRTWEAIRRAVR